jgi:DNA topoisomerase-2
MAKKIEDKYKILSQVEHILHRPQTYVGSNKPNTDVKYIIIDEKVEQREITYIPSFIKIFDEVITNSVDEHQRNKKLNKIDVTVDVENNIISIKDNGGIPVELHKEYKQYVPEVIFGNLMSGSNYDDSDERTVAGLNGLGAKLTNVFSTEFEVVTCDGKKHFTQIFTNNMGDRTKPKIKAIKSSYTKIQYKPDLKQFGLDKIDEDHFKMIEKRVYDLAGTNPNISFTFNNKSINFSSFEDYIKLYTDEFFYETKKDKSWSIGIALSENGFQQVSFANSTETYDGGTHVDYILNQIISDLRSYFLKKHKVDVKPSELKNHIFLFLNSTVINPSFSSQTKEKLITEIRDFGYEFIVSKKMIQSILKSEIVNSILDWIEQKKNADESKIQRQLNKKLSKIKVEKLIDSKGKERWKSQLYIFEGDSAASSFRKYRDPQIMGAFSLRGKFINSSEISNQKLVSNKEAVNLMAAIGLKLGQKVSLKDLRYGRILLASDADVDGNSITALLINFFYRYWPELFENKMLWKLETPIVAVISKKGKKDKKLFYTQTEYDNWASKNDLKSFEVKYKKGLAALVDDEYKDIINSPRMTLITSDDLSNDSLDTWFGKSSELRKIELLK